MGTSPIVVLATISVEPLSSNSKPWVSVIAASNVVKAMLFKDWSGWFEKEISRSAMFPVDTPPRVLDCGNLSYAKTPPSEHEDDRGKKNEPQQRPGHPLEELYPPRLAQLVRRTQTDSCTLQGCAGSSPTARMPHSALS